MPRLPYQVVRRHGAGADDPTSLPYRTSPGVPGRPRARPLGPSLGLVTQTGSPLEAGGAALVTTVP
eukprot:766638-Hanusia_phi.AAC.6